MSKNNQKLIRDSSPDHKFNKKRKKENKSEQSFFDYDQYDKDQREKELNSPQQKAWRSLLRNWFRI